MAITERELRRAEARMEMQCQASHAVSARYDRRSSRIIVGLNTGVQIAFPADLAEGLAGAAAADLARIEISPAGLGLHWPRLDADLYVLSLLQGMLGAKSWMARQLGAAGAGRAARRRRQRRVKMAAKAAAQGRLPVGEIRCGVSARPKD
jgi:hypothetical protein